MGAVTYAVLICTMIRAGTATDCGGSACPARDFEYCEAVPTKRLWTRNACVAEARALSVPMSPGTDARCIAIDPDAQRVR